MVCTTGNDRANRSGCGSPLSYLVTCSLAIGLLVVLHMAVPRGEQGGSRTASRDDRLHTNLLDDMATADLAVHGAQASYLSYAKDSLVSVVLAVSPGQTASVMRRVEERRGIVDASDERVGYIRARVPASAWPELRRSADIDAAQLDARRLPKGWSDTGPAFANNLSGDVPAEPAERPVSKETGSARLEMSATDVERLRAGALRAMQVDTLAVEHPTFDGRGIGIAIVEPDAASADRAHPAFEHALALDGSRIPKIIGFLPGREKPWSIVPAERRVDGDETVVRIDGAVYTLPRPGIFSFGRFHLVKTYYAVLWDRATKEVWIDTNQDRSFQNETRLSDAPGHEAGAVFPHEVGWRGGRFTVVPSRDRDEVVIVPIDVRAHAAMTASVAAGSDVEGHAAVGLAPAARIMFVSLNGTSMHAAVEALLAAAADPRVDLISVSSALGESIPASDQEVLGLVIDRLIMTYGKLIIRAAGNGYVPEALHHAAGARALSVGASLTPIAAQLFSGITDATDDRVWPYSTRGPKSNGLGGVDVIGPTNIIAATSCHPPIVRYAGPFRLPPCTMLSAGTSASAPIVAGVAARLLSGLKQQGRSVTSAELAWALRASARPLVGYRAMDQGSGIPQAHAAWQLLSGRIRPPTIETWSALTHPLSAYRREADRGASLYEREGWSPGQRGRRAITLLRRDGPPGPQTYLVNLRGNDGTFSAPSMVSLPLAVPVDLPLQIVATSPGFHNAMLLLREPATRTIFHQQQITIVVADTFRRETGYAVKYGQPLHDARTAEHAIFVPPGLYGLRVSLRLHGSTPDAGAMLMLMDPRGAYYERRIGRMASTVVPAGTPTEFTLPNPSPGTWLVNVIPSNAVNSTADLWKRISVRYELELKALQMHIEGKPSQTENVLDVSAVNVGGTIQDFEPALELAKMRQTQARFADRQQPLVFSITVERGTSSLAVRVGTPESPCGLHLYVYDCTSGTCIRHDAVLPAARTQVARIRSEVPGTWKAAVTPGPACVGHERVSMETFTVERGLGTVTPTATTSGQPSVITTGQRWTRQYRVDLTETADHPSVVAIFTTGQTGLARSESGDDNSHARAHGQIAPFGYVVPLQVVLKETASR